MGKKLIITEKPSVAMEYAKILKTNTTRKNGYLESDEYIITWCVGHLVTMSYPEKYDASLKYWRLETLPFIPKNFKYEVIEQVKDQFEIVKGLLTREDLDCIYVGTDSGREGEYIYRLVDDMAHVTCKNKKRIWIDSQTEEAILNGINNAKDLSEYDNISESAYLRAKEDYLIGINFSRLLSLAYSDKIQKYTEGKIKSISIGRVMTCVLGLIVDREREIRNFKKTDFYKLQGSFGLSTSPILADWKVTEKSLVFNSPLLYSETGFKKEKDALDFIEKLKNLDKKPVISEISKKKQKENAPLLYNLAELQNECSKRFKISPDKTLEVVQELYEKKMVTYPRTDARVLSTAVAKEINKNLNGIFKSNKNVDISAMLNKMKEEKYSTNLLKTKYVNDSKITDHYAIIPTGQGFENYDKLTELSRNIFDLITKRFLSIFFPPAVFNKTSIVITLGTEIFTCNTKVCESLGYLEFIKPDKKETSDDKPNLDEIIKNLKKGQEIDLVDIVTVKGETSPPSRYTSGSLILAMENAGKLIEDEELREQIKGSGIGTSATRAEIIKKLIRICDIQINEKTQVLTPTNKGEVIYDIVKVSIPNLLNPTLTASWEKGLDLVARGEIKPDEFMNKLVSYINKNTNKVINTF